MVRVIRNNHKISQCQKCPGIRLNWELRSIWISILPLVFLGLFKSLLVNVVGSMVRGIHFWFSFFQISMHYLLCAKLLRNFKYSSTSRPFCWRCTLGRVKKAKMLEYFYWKVVLAFWFGHPKCHFLYPQMAKNRQNDLFRAFFADLKILYYDYMCTEMDFTQQTISLANY